MKPNPSAYETILVPVDFSEPSRAALHQAHLIAGDDLARLVVLHVSEPVSAHWHMDLNRIQKEAHEAARQKLTAFIKEEFPKSAPRSHFMTGNPHDAREVRGEVQRVAHCPRHTRALRPEARAHRQRRRARGAPCAVHRDGRPVKRLPRLSGRPR